MSRLNAIHAGLLWRPWALLGTPGFRALRKLVADHAIIEEHFVRPEHLAEMTPACLIFRGLESESSLRRFWRPAADPL